MPMRTLMIALAGLQMIAGNVSASELHAGASATVKANTVWFQDAEQLAGWQTLHDGGDTAALATYEEELLSERDAWRFTNPLAVKILSIDAATHQANVEMTAPGRMLGTTWFVDDGAIEE